MSTKETGRKEAKPLIKAAVYARFSTKYQDSRSIDDQIRDARDEAAKRGWTLDEDRHVFVDEGKSGGSAAPEHRPGLQAMLDAGERGEFQAILITDMYRLSRDINDMFRVCSDITDADIRLISIDDEVDSKKEEEFDIQKFLKGYVGQSQRKASANRVRAAAKGRALDGLWATGRLWCFRTGPKKKIIAPNGREKDVSTPMIQIPEQVEILKRIWKMSHVDRKPDSEIARILNAEGVESPGASGNRRHHGDTTRLPRIVAKQPLWRNTGITEILDNPAYCGYLRWGRSSYPLIRKTGKRDRKPQEEDTWVKGSDRSMPGQYIPWLDCKIPLEWWQDRMAGKVPHRYRRGSSGRPPTFLLGGVLVCGICGRRLQVESRKAFTCPSDTVVQGQRCLNRRILRHEVEKAILDTLHDKLSSAETIKYITRCIEQEYRAIESVPVEPSLPAAITVKIAELERQIADVRASNFPDVAKQGAVAALEAERAALRAKAARVLQQRESGMEKAIADVPRILKKYREKIANGAKGLSAKPEHVRDARKAIQALLADGTITVNLSSRLQDHVDVEIPWSEYGTFIPSVPARQRRERVTDNDGVC